MSSQTRAADRKAVATIMSDAKGACAIRASCVFGFSCVAVNKRDLRCGAFQKADTTSG